MSVSGWPLRTHSPERGPGDPNLGLIAWGTAAPRPRYFLNSLLPICCILQLRPCFPSLCPRESVSQSDHGNREASCRFAVDTYEYSRIVTPPYTMAEVEPRLVAKPVDIRLPPDSSTISPKLTTPGMRSGHLNLDTFSPVNQNGSFVFDRVLKSGEVHKRTRKTKVSILQVLGSRECTLICDMSSNGSPSTWYFGPISFLSTNPPQKSVF